MDLNRRFVVESISIDEFKAMLEDRIRFHKSIVRMHMKDMREGCEFTNEEDVLNQRKEYKDIVNSTLYHDIKHNVESVYKWLESKETDDTLSHLADYDGCLPCAKHSIKSYEEWVKAR